MGPSWLRTDRKRVLSRTTKSGQGWCTLLTLFAHVDGHAEPTSLLDYSAQRDKTYRCSRVARSSGRAPHHSLTCPYSEGRMPGSLQWYENVSGQNERCRIRRRSAERRPSFRYI